jgi:hypothetical protein
VEEGDWLLSRVCRYSSIAAASFASPITLLHSPPAHPKFLNAPN